MRLKPRFNSEVNQYWICDEGRYDYHFIDQNRILWPQEKQGAALGPASWEEALEKIAKKIQELKSSNQTDKIGIIASAKLTNEDLFVIRKLFKESLGISNVDFRVPEKPGSSDDFLIKADKNPNTTGAEVILKNHQVTSHPSTELRAGQTPDTRHQIPVTSAEEIIQKALVGEVRLLYVFGHDLVKLFSRETVEQLSKKVDLFVLQASNLNETCAFAHLILPSSVYAEKDGTFTNCQQRVQRIWPAFPPMGEAKGDWEILAALAEKLGIELGRDKSRPYYRTSEEIFNDLAKSIPAFADMNYEKIGDQGMVLNSEHQCMSKVTSPL